MEVSKMSRPGTGPAQRAAVVVVAALFIMAAAGCVSWFTPEDPDRVCPVVPEGTMGVYGTKLPAADAAARLVRLKLAPENRCELTTVFLDDTPAVIETGTWDYIMGRRVRVKLTRREGAVYEKPSVIIFAAESGRLTAVRYDREEWGDEGLILVRNTTVTGPVWRLMQIRYPDNTALAPENPSRYALILSQDGTVTVVADCNRGMATYLVAGTALHMKDFAYTRMICPENSLFDPYTEALREASACTLKDGRLTIWFRSDTGSMEFEPARSDE
ncbi:MAG TPA: META domain-containing protein [Deltaproteobacteria bacterium]|nr:META domain-containing protein [Deltaproteobacteria bacterium]